MSTDDINGAYVETDISRSLRQASDGYFIIKQGVVWNLFKITYDMDVTRRQWKMRAANGLSGKAL